LELAYTGKCRRRPRQCKERQGLLERKYGKFDLRGLAPGSYKIFSFTGVQQGEWEDPEFLKTQEARGESVEVQDEDVKTVNLKLIEQKSEATE
jgi:hypothetical protein